jgi:hypothetical protein
VFIVLKIKFIFKHLQFRASPQIYSFLVKIKLMKLPKTNEKKEGFMTKMRLKWMVLMLIKIMYFGMKFKDSETKGITKNFYIFISFISYNIFPSTVQLIIDPFPSHNMCWPYMASSGVSKSLKLFYCMACPNFSYHIWMQYLLI